MAVAGSSCRCVCHPTDGPGVRGLKQNIHETRKCWGKKLTEPFCVFNKLSNSAKDLKICMPDPVPFISIYIITLS